MRYIARAGLLGLLVVVLGGCALSLPGGTGGDSKPVSPDASLAEHLSGQVLVRPADGAAPEAIAAAVGGEVILVRDGLIRIKLPAGASVSKSVAALKDRPDVSYAEPVYIYRTQVTGPPTRAAITRGYETDYFDRQWGPGSIHATELWAAPGLPAGLSGIRVAVVDTGIDENNPEFAGRIVGGYNAVNPGQSFYDNEGHGTHVTGIIAASHADAGIKGIAGTVLLLSVKVLSADGSGTNQSVADGIRWAAKPIADGGGGADVINLSLGGWGRSRAIQEAVDYALSQGVVVVAAMGNEYRYGTTHYPAACEGVIAVGATRPDGTKASFSSEGPYISVSAPGDSIFSTIWTSAGSSFAFWSGTSMATPHVTGLVALLLAQDATRTPTMIRTLLEHYASAPLAWSKKLGHGVVNARAAYIDEDNVADAYGSLRVTVTGGSVNDAEVLIRATPGGDTVTANRTNQDGVAHFHFLKDGTYQVTVTKGALSGTATVDIAGGTPANSIISISEPGLAGI